jgi:cytochrome c556
MHRLVKHIKSNFGIVLLSLIFLSATPQSSANQSVEEIIKGRKALFSKNYSTAKRVQTFSSNEDFDQAKKLMIEMSENYKTLIGMFPENTKEGFKTEALPLIWQEKDDFNTLMKKSSDDMIKFTGLIEESDNIKGTLNELMWSNCKACHSKYRKPH